MNKSDFLTQLSYRLKYLPESEYTGTLQYYDEMISDRMDSGESEEDIIASLGHVDEIAKRLTAEQSFKQAREKSSVSGWLKALLSVLFVFSAPVAIPIIIALFVVAMALLISLFAVLFSFIATFGSLIIAGIAIFIFGISVMITNPAVGLALMGASLICMGLGLALLVSSIWLIKISGKLIKELIEWISKRIYDKKKKGQVFTDQQKGETLL